MPIQNWSAAMSQFTILFDSRVPMSGINKNSLTQKSLEPPIQGRARAAEALSL
jgi:hypothetical protein